VRDKPHIKPIRTYVHDRQTDAINRNRSLRDEIADDLWRGGKRLHNGVAFSLPITDRARSVNMTLHEVTAKPSANREGAFVVESIPNPEFTKVCAPERLKSSFDCERPVVASDHGQARTVHGNAVADARAFQGNYGLNSQARTIGCHGYLAYRTRLFNDAREHPGNLPSTC
jgi:hypothetical protein